MANGNGAPVKLAGKFTPDSQPILAILVAVAFISLVALWMLRPPTGDAASLALLNALIMVVGTAFLTIVNFYFSSSRGSSGKDDTILAMATGTGPGGTPPATVTKAAEAAAPAAAAEAAPPAAAVAAPPAAEAAVAAALAERGPH